MFCHDRSFFSMVMWQAGVYQGSHVVLEIGTKGGIIREVELHGGSLALVACVA